MGRNAIRAGIKTLGWADLAVEIYFCIVTARDSAKIIQYVVYIKFTNTIKNSNIYNTNHKKVLLRSLNIVL